MTRSLVISDAGYGHGPVSRAGEALHLAVADNHRATVIYSLGKIAEGREDSWPAGEHGNTSQVIGARKARWVCCDVDDHKIVLFISHTYSFQDGALAGAG
jgi:hypothetical protein